MSAAMEIKKEEMQCQFAWFLQGYDFDSIHITYSLIFVFAQVGGFDGLNRLRTAEVYNEEVNSWSMLPNMLNPRSNFGLEVVDDIIVVAGGFNGVMTVCKAEGYDCKSKTWYDLAEMAVNRSALSCCVVDDLPNVVMFAAPRDFLRSPVRREDGLQASLSML